MAPTSSPRVGWLHSKSRFALANSRARMTFCALPPDNLRQGADGPVAAMEWAPIAVRALASSVDERPVAPARLPLFAQPFNVLMRVIG